MKRYHHCIHISLYLLEDVPDTEKTCQVKQNILLDSLYSIQHFGANRNSLKLKNDASLGQIIASLSLIELQLDFTNVDLKRYRFKIG